MCGVIELLGLRDALALLLGSSECAACAVVPAVVEVLDTVIWERT
jgi:hypothetical protein